MSRVLTAVSALFLAGTLSAPVEAAPIFPVTFVFMQCTGVAPCDGPHQWVLQSDGSYLDELGDPGAWSYDPVTGEITLIDERTGTINVGTRTPGTRCASGWFSNPVGSEGTWDGCVP